jgi:hypothetical protein
VTIFERDGQGVPRLPTAIERAYLGFFKDMMDSRPALEFQFFQAMFWGSKTGEITLPTSEDPFPHYRSDAYGRTTAGAQIYASSVLISCYAILENLYAELGYEKPNNVLSVAFGPVFNDITFTELLWAGANNARHGREWKRAGIQGFLDLVAGSSSAARGKTVGPYDARQWKSIWRIRAGLDLQPSFSEGIICYEILRLISDGDFAQLMARLYRVAQGLSGTVTDGVDAFRSVVSYMKKSYGWDSDDAESADSTSSTDA